MKRPTSFLTLLLAVMTTSNVTQQTMPRLEPFGLQGERITALRFAPQFGPYRYNLYATTDGNGVYRHDPTRSDSLWLRLGLYGKKITALDIQVWGIGPAVFHTPIVGVWPDYSSGDSTLIYLLEENGWAPADSGMSRDHFIFGLASFASLGYEPPGFAFASTLDGFVYRSHTRSQRWEAVRAHVGTDAPSVNALGVNQNGAISEVWIGGYTGLMFLPWIQKSVDMGLTWQSLPINLNLGVENGCHTFGFDPIDPSIVYAGMDGTAIKTIDGGKTWMRTGLRDTLLVHFSGLALDPVTPKHLYASGRDARMLWESIDAGMTWQKIVPKFSLAGITRIVADPNTPGVIYIATAGDGVWRYQSEVVAVQDRHKDAQPRDLVLQQNYPNPFNVGTIIRFEISSTLANASARLAIYNLRGELVRELLNRRLTANRYLVRWDGRNDAGIEVASGIYFCRLQVGNAAEIQKLSLVN